MSTLDVTRLHRLERPSAREAGVEHLNHVWLAWPRFD